MTRRKRKCFVCGADLTDKQYDKVTCFDAKGNTAIQICCPGRCATKLSKSYVKEKSK